jgi:acetyl-CoA carboxylase biotin carboxyl carrier protein
VALDLNELRELLAAIDQTDIAELTLKSADFELTLRRGVRPAEVVAVPAAPAIATSPVPTLEPAKEAALPPSTPPPPPPGNDRRFAEITSPMVGTFYRAPSPDDSPFVEVGDRIRKGQTVCIIEAMKLMNELETEVAGEIVEILVQNGEPVEYGQLLMRVSPD